MNEVFRVDQKEFQTTLRTLAANTSHSLDVFLNSRAFSVVKEARAQTPIADRQKIMTELGATLVSQKTDKKGRIRRKHSYKPTKVVYAILNARQRRNRMPPYPKSEIAMYAEKLIAGRLRAIGTLRSGWTRALAILAGKIFASVEGGGPRVRQPSTVVPAKPGWSPFVEIQYRETVSNGLTKQIDPRVVSALEGGFAKEQGEMLSHLEQKMQGVLKKSGI